MYLKETEYKNNAILQLWNSKEEADDPAKKFPLFAAGAKKWRTIVSSFNDPALSQAIVEFVNKHPAQE